MSFTSDSFHRGAAVFMMFCWIRRAHSSSSLRSHSGSIFARTERIDKFPAQRDRHIASYRRAVFPANEQMITKINNPALYAGLFGSLLGLAEGAEALMRTTTR